MKAPIGDKMKEFLDIKSRDKVLELYLKAGEVKRGEIVTVDEYSFRVM